MPVDIKPAMIDSAPVSVQEVKQPLFNTNIMTDRIDWTRVTACMSNADSCVCYGLSLERLMIPKETCELAVKNGWPKV
jgi:zona occludens toxin